MIYFENKNMSRDLLLKQLLANKNFMSNDVFFSWNSFAVATVLYEQF